MSVEKKPFHASYIDGLRAIAVLSVIVYHLNGDWLPGGFAGVDVFFVISGFVVSMSVSELGQISFSRFLGYFYARRLVRITPALIVCLLVTFLASAAFIPDAWLSASNQKTGLFAFFGLSNFILSSNTGNYFSPVAEFNPFTHTWSLAVEEQFYLIFPLMFFGWLRGLTKFSIATFVIALLGSLTCAAILVPKDQAQSFYMIWTRFWELSTGVLLFQMLHYFGHSFDEPSPHRVWYAMLGNVGLLLVGIGLTFAKPELAPFPACLAPVVGTALILGSLHGRCGGTAYFLLTRQPMVFVGKISYSLYLWHWPIFVLFRWTVGLEAHKWQVAAIFLTAVLSILSYYIVEQPPRRIARGAKKLAVIATGLSAAFASYALASVVVTYQPSISLSVVSKNRDLWYPEGAVLTTSGADCGVTTKNVNFEGGFVLEHRRDACSKSVDFSGNIFVLGDSHAMHYTSLLKKVVAETGAVVYSYTVGGCPFISLQSWVAGRDDICKAFGDAAVANMLPKIRPGDVVFLPSLRIPRMVDQWAVFGSDAAKRAMFSDIAQQGREQGIQNAVPILKKISDRGAQIVLEAPTPMLESVPFRCSDWFNKSNPICKRGMSMQRAELEELRFPIIESYEKIKEEIHRVAIWDPLPILCSDTECAASRDGKPLLFDGDHLTYYANMLLYPAFVSFINSLESQH